MTDSLSHPLLPLVFASCVSFHDEAYMHKKDTLANCAELIRATLEVEEQTKGKNNMVGVAELGDFYAKYMCTQLVQSIELDSINLLCDDYCNKLQNIFQLTQKSEDVEECSNSNYTQLQPQTQSTSKRAEKKEKGDVDTKKPEEVMVELKRKYGDALSALQVGYVQSKKKKRNLSKQATDALNLWFFNHLHDPYPTDEEKSVLAGQCGLTLSQVNNWFGNKRMRYKRKMMDQSRKGGAGGSQEDMSPGDSPPQGPTNTVTHVQPTPTRPNATNGIPAQQQQYLYQ